MAVTSPRRKRRGFPTSRWGFPASLEVACRALVQTGLTLPPQAYRFPQALR